MSAIVKCYLTLSQSDRQCATWKCSVSDNDVSRLCRSFLSLDTVVESETQRRSQYDVETWLSNTPFILQMFDRVFYNVFPIIAVSMNFFAFFLHFFPISLNSLRNNIVKLHFKTNPKLRSHVNYNVIGFLVLLNISTR